MDINLNNIFSLAQASLKMSDLNPVRKSNFNKVRKITGIDYTYEDIVKVLDANGLDIKNLYVSEKGLYPFWYIDKYTYLGLPEIDGELLKAGNYKDTIKKNNDRMEGFWKVKDYKSFFFILENAFRFDYFMNHIDEISEDKIYPIFRDIYTKNEYGFSKLDKDTVRKIFSLNADKRFKRKLKTDSNGYVTIYRGQESKSTDIDNAYSWTLSYDVAIKFAVRFNSLSGKIYKAKVHIDNIVDCIDDRNEEEILVLPESLENVEDMGLINFNEEFVNDFWDCIQQYNYLKTEYIQSEWFERPNGIHGLLHTKRVLLLALVISSLEDLDERDSNILTISACLHDIGRRNEDKDDDHGLLSVYKIEDYDILEDVSIEFDFDEEEKNIIKAIIKYHPIDDKNGEKAIIEDDTVEQKPRAIRLYKLLKDADSLDRVRLNDLDIRYLRNNSSKRLVILAHQLLINLR